MKRYVLLSILVAVCVCLLCTPDEYAQKVIVENHEVVYSDEDVRSGCRSGQFLKSDDYYFFQSTKQKL